MAVKSSLLSLVFTDLVDSTALKTPLGDQPAGELIERHHERVRQLRAETHVPKCLAATSPGSTTAAR